MKSAADDLGLTEESRKEYSGRLLMMFAEGCAIFGSAAAATMFRKIAATKRAGKVPPPRKRKGGHDPQGDRMLLELWRFYGGTKQAFAEMAIKNHAVKTGKKVQPHTIQVRSMVRRLDRLLAAK
jgi:hypothetical protein